MVAGLVSAISRELAPGGTNAFNLGVDFKGGTVVTTKFRQRPTDNEIRDALNGAGITDPVIQATTNKPDEVLIKIPLLESTAGQDEQQQQQQVRRVDNRLRRRSIHSVKKAEGELTLDTAPDCGL
jgi:preprotein translocase subunit SecF